MIVEPLSQPQTASHAVRLSSLPARSAAYTMVVDRRTTLRSQECILAALWLIGTGFWGTVGIGSYVQNIGTTSFSLVGFGVAYFFICLTAFGLRYIGHVALAVASVLVKRGGAAGDTVPAFIYGGFMVCGALFSLASITVVLLHTLGSTGSDSALASWVGIVIISLMLAVGFGCIAAAVTTFEPYLRTPATALRLRLPGKLLSQRIEPNTPDTRDWHMFRATGPLVREADSRSPIERGGVGGLQKTLALRNNTRIGTLGFVSENGQPTLFAAGAGATIHFAAGGRTGRVVPPGFTFWLPTDRVQYARLDPAQTFLTYAYRVPPVFDTTRFCVPSCGGRFAWFGSDSIHVGAWHSNRSQSIPLDAPPLPARSNFAPFAFSPDGTRLAWADTAGHMRCWNVETNRTHGLRAFPGEVWGVIFSSDGLKVATVGNTGVLLQNVQTGWRWFMACDPKETTPTTLAIAPTGYHIALALSLRDGGAVVRVVDLFAARYYDLPAAEPLTHLLFSPDNRLLCGVDVRGGLALWDTAAGLRAVERSAEAGSHSRLPENAIHAAHDLTPQRVLGPELEEVVLPLDDQQPRARHDLSVHDQPVALAFSPDSSGLITGVGSQLRWWDVAALLG